MRIVDNMLIGWRRLLSQPVASSALILSLVIGLASGFLLLGFVHYSFQYDSDVPQQEQVYLLKHKVNLMAQPLWTEYMPLPVRQVLLDSGLPLEVSMVMPRNFRLKTANGMRRQEVVVVDPSFADIMGLHPMQGDLTQALQQPDGIAITESVARQLFGVTSVLGQQMDFNGRLLQVRAVLADAPANSVLPYSALVGMNSQLWPASERKERLAMWQAAAARILVRIPPSVQPQTVQTLLQKAADQSSWRTLAPEVMARHGHVMEIGLGTLAQAYFDTDVAAFRGGPRAERRLVLSLAGVAFLIVLVAASNYVNLASLKLASRQREIAMRKVLGAGRWRLILQFQSEALCVTIFASILALLLAWMLLPLFSNLVQRDLHAMFSAPLCLGLLGLGALVGVLSGIYPCYCALRVRPAQALSGRDDGTGERRSARYLRRVLSIAQFSIALALTGIALAMGWQTYFVQHVDPGFDASALHLISLPQREEGAALATQEVSRSKFSAAIARLPGVIGVTHADRAIGSNSLPSSAEFQREGSASVSGNFSGNKQAINLMEVSPNFFEVYGVHVLAGRGFDAARPASVQKQSLLLNDAAARVLGFSSSAAALGQRVRMVAENRKFEVIGIAPQLRQQNLHQVEQPQIYVVAQNTADVLSLRLSAGTSLPQEQIARLWAEHFPQQVLEMQPAQSVLAANYADQARLTQLLLASSVIAAGIAGFGVYVLLAHNLQRRQREIVIRKLHGAGKGAIASLLGRELLLLLLASAVPGLAVAWWAIQTYLASFVEHAPYVNWLPVAALLLAVLMAVALAWRHNVLAFRLRAVDALRG